MTIYPITHRLTGQADRRYTITTEHSGAIVISYVVRFCDAAISFHLDETGARAKAEEHDLKRWSDWESFIAPLPRAAVSVR